MNEKNEESAAQNYQSACNSIGKCLHEISEPTKSSFESPNKRSLRETPEKNGEKWSAHCTLFELETNREGAERSHTARGISTWLRHATFDESFM